LTENVRTVDAARAIAQGDLVALGNAMRASHHSLKNDFEVSVPAVDALVDCLNLAIGNEGGARMTGGGFGGCVVAVLPFNKMDAVKRALGAFWHAKGMRPQLGIVARPSAGACLLPI
jgi:galactokinase